MKDWLNKSREKRKERVDQLKQKESQNIVEEALKEKTEECDRLTKANTTQKNEMEAIAMRLTKEIEERKKNEEKLA